MSRFLRALACDSKRPFRAVSGIVGRIVEQVQTGVFLPGDLAAAATVLAKRPAEAEALLGISEAHSSSPLVKGVVASQLLEGLGTTALRRLVSFSPAEATELLHALGQAPCESFRSGLTMNGQYVEKIAKDLDGRSLALVSNAYARLHLREVAVFRVIARRGIEVVPEADAMAAAALAHAFAKLRIYHHGLFSALKRRLQDLAGELSSPHVAQSLVAFASSLPPPQKADPIEYAFDDEKGFGLVIRALLVRLRFLLNSEPLSQDTTLLAMRGLELLRVHDTELNSHLVKSLDWSSLKPTGLCTALQAAATLEAPHPGASVLGYASVRNAVGAQLHVFVASLAILQYAMAPRLLNAARSGHGLTSRWRWDHVSICSWLRLLGRAVELPPGKTEAEDGFRASPRVALASLALLPPFANHLAAYLALPDLMRFVRFSRSPRPPPVLTSSEFQSGVELALRRVALVDGTRIEVTDEVCASPFWIDLIVSES